MSIERVQNLIPFVHVTDVERSIAFYELLGFDLKDTYEHDGQLDWAALESRDAQLMLARASAPIERDKQAVLSYLYADDLAALREQLVAAGVPVGEIRDGPRRPGRLVPDGRRDRVAVAGCRAVSAGVRSRSCPADADTPPDHRSASCPRADARERRLAGLLGKALCYRRRSHEAGQHRIHGRLARRIATRRP
jgi:predicted enzyme related to lactoylglutathione lyase